MCSDLWLPKSIAPSMKLLNALCMFSQASPGPAFWVPRTNLEAAQGALGAASVGRGPHAMTVTSRKIEGTRVFFRIYPDSSARLLYWTAVLKMPLDSLILKAPLSFAAFGPAGNPCER